MRISLYKLLYTTMKTLKVTIGLVGLMILFSNLLYAETDRNLLVKRWKLVKHQKASKDIPFSNDDFIQLGGNGVYEQIHNNFYSKGNWALNEDEISVFNQGEHVWKIISMTDTKMSLKKGTDETMELEMIKLPAPIAKNSSSHLNYLCNGKWRPNEQHKGNVAVKFQTTDITTFFSDGSYEQVVNGKYSKGTWSFNKDQTMLTIDKIEWKVETITALFLKISDVKDANEFMIFAKTR